MSRSLSRWTGIAAICAAILLVPLVGGVKEGMSGVEHEFRLLGPVNHGFQGKDRDCESFHDRRAAQRFFLRHGGPQRDPHLLDANTRRGRDGRACGEFDYGGR
jgi:hypothetical protein